MIDEKHRRLDLLWEVEQDERMRNEHRREAKYTHCDDPIYPYETGI